MPTSWEDALSIASKKMENGKTTFVAGDLVNVEALYSSQQIK